MGSHSVPPETPGHKCCSICCARKASVETLWEPLCSILRPKTCFLWLELSGINEKERKQVRTHAWNNTQGWMDPACPVFSLQESCISLSVWIPITVLLAEMRSFQVWIFSICLKVTFGSSQLVTYSLEMSVNHNKKEFSKFWNNWVFNIKL